MNNIVILDTKLSSCKTLRITDFEFECKRNGINTDMNQWLYEHETDNSNILSNQYKAKDRYGWSEIRGIYKSLDCSASVILHPLDSHKDGIVLTVNSNIPIYDGTCFSGFHGVGVYKYDIINIIDIIHKYPWNDNDNYNTNAIYISRPNELIFDSAEQKLYRFELWRADYINTHNAYQIYTKSGFININDIVMCANNHTYYR